jgi:tetratricopeptide (TPR) repeat protein
MIDQKFEYAYGNRGLAYGKSGQYEKSIEDFSMAIQLNPDRPDNYFNRGMAYRRCGKTRESLDDYKKAASLGSEAARQILKSQDVKW